MLYLRHARFEGQGLSRAKNRALGSATAHALLQELLAQLSLPYTLKTSAAGRPSLKDIPTVDFNLSHTDTLAVCALLQGENAPRVGVDAEDTATLSSERAEALAARFFAPCEQKALAEARDKITCFTRIFTKKEAYAKYCGNGLGAHLRSTDTMQKDFESKARVRFYTYREGATLITLCLPQHVTDLPITTLSPYQE